MPDAVDEIFGADAVEYDEFSDPEEDELLAQMAEETEEHARFASQLNHRPAGRGPEGEGGGGGGQEAYERELRALRTQQRKDRRDADEVTQAMVAECQALLRHFGIPYVTAPMEAEAQCAELVRLSLVDGVVTDDSDIFLFGGTRVYKNVFNGNRFVECYLAPDIERELELPRERLVALAQLLGSDYAEGLPGVGPVTAVEILSEFPGRDGLARFRDWWQDAQQRANHMGQAEAGAGAETSTFRRKFRRSQAARLFLPTGFPSPAVDEAYLRPEVDGSPEPFRWGVPDVEGLRGFLAAAVGWSRERTDEVLVPVVRDMNRRDAEGTQSNITQFFDGPVGVGARMPGPGAGAGAAGNKRSSGGRGGEAFAPRRRKPQTTSKRMAEAVSRLRAKKNTGQQEAAAATAAGSSVAAAEGEGRRGGDDGADDDDDDDDADDDDFVDGEEQHGGGGVGVRKPGRQNSGKGKGKKSRAKKGGAKGVGAS